MTWYVAPHEIELLAEIEKTFKRLEYSYSLGKIFSFDFPDGIRVSFRRSYDIQGIEAEEILRKYQENLKGESLKNQGCIAKIASKYCDATGELYRPSLLYTLTSSEKELAQYLPKFQQEGLWKENLLKIGGQWGTQQIRPFLRGLFTTDGCINQDTDLIHLAGTISFANKSSALVEEIRSLLAILGINSTKSYTPNTGGFLGDGVYTLRLIGTTSRNRFLDLIGFATTKKQERLELLREIEIGNYDKLPVLPFPNNLGKVLPKYDRKWGLSHKEQCIFNDLRAERTNLNPRSLKILNRIEKGFPGTIPALESQWLVDAEQNEWIQEKIVSIEHIGTHEMFDVVGSESGSFLGNGFVLHNCHVNRIPYTGFLKYEYLDPITSRNYPMLMIEKGIIKEDFNFQGEDYKYLKKNERMFNQIYSPKLDLTYYVIQIADVDVSAITHFDQDQNELRTQNERFSAIRWGSQLDLIVPLDDRYEFKFVHNVTDAVQAGLDKVISIKKV